MIRLTLMHAEGQNRHVYVAVSHIVSAQVEYDGCLVTTTRAAYHVREPVDNIIQAVNTSLQR